KQPCQDCASGCQQCVEEGECRLFVGTQSRTRIEAKPAYPQQGSTCECHRQVVWLHWFTAISHTLACEPCTAQRCHPRVDMHHGTASKIQCTAFKQPATRCPYHVRNRQIRECHPQDQEDDNGAIAHALGKASYDQRASDTGKGGLK